MTSPVQIVAGQPVLASDFDQYEILTGAWESYTPTWSSDSTPPSLGNGTLVGQKIQVGKLLICRARLTLGSTSTLGTGIWTISLPATIDTTTDNIGAASLTDSGTNIFTGSCRQFLATTVAFTSASGFVTPTVPFTWSAANADQLAFVLVGEVA